MNAVHRQRIALAVRAVHERQIEVSFTVVTDDERAYVAWVLCGLRYVIAAGSTAEMRALLPEVQREFTAQSRKVSGEVVVGSAG